MSSKDAINKAKLEFDSIVKLAQDNLLRESEEKIHKMIEEAIDEVQKEETEEVDPSGPANSTETINEMIKLETDDMKIVVDDDGSTKVEHKEPEAAEGGEPVDAVTQTPVDTAPKVSTPAADTTAVDSAPDEEPIEISSDDDEIQIAAEADNQQPEMDPNTQPAAAAPAPAPVAPEAAPEAAPAGDDLATQLADVINKMIAAQTGGDAGDGTGEGDVDIVDDETGAPAAGAPAPAPAPAPAMEEIELYEDELVELELEEDEAIVDEVKAMGQSHALNRTAGPHTAPSAAVKNRTRTGAKMNESTDQNKAQYEATIAELKKDNASLKNQIGEYKTAFIELREHVHEVQDFSKKLSFAYRATMNGVWTEKEKQRISERFESARDAEEAAKIYKEIMSENKTTQDKGVIKSSAIPVVKPKTEPIYESASVKRAKRLAGIEGPDPESLIG